MPPDPNQTPRNVPPWVCTCEYSLVGRDRIATTTASWQRNLTCNTCPQTRTQHGDHLGEYHPSSLLLPVPPPRIMRSAPYVPSGPARWILLVSAHTAVVRLP